MSAGKSQLKRCSGGMVAGMTVLVLAAALWAQEDAAQQVSNSTETKATGTGSVTWDSAADESRVAHNDLNSLPAPPVSVPGFANDFSIGEPATPVALQDNSVSIKTARENLGLIDDLPPPAPVVLPPPTDDRRKLPTPTVEYFQSSEPETTRTKTVKANTTGKIPIQRHGVVVTAPEKGSSRITKSDGISQVGTTDFILAAQPKPGERFFHRLPQTDQAATLVDPEIHDFSPTPVSTVPYDAGSEMHVYEGKCLNANRRPLVELGRPWYQLGQLKPGGTWLGSHNLVSNQFLIYGDYRMAYANAKNRDREFTSQAAFELNLNFDWRITATERLTAFVSPLDQGNRNLRWLLDEDRVVDETNFNVLFGMFEGDLGVMVGGMCGQTLPFDLPFALGVMPLVVQNGVWMEDALTGVAATIPARNCAPLDISNMDITFFAGFDEIDSPAFEGDNAAARMFGVLTFIESCGGYWEIDYALLDDRDRTRIRSYHNLGLAFTRRYGRFISNSVRVIGNAGQATINGPNTADGVILLVENSLITSQPNSFVPYFNFWAGFDRPQSAARAAQAGGILRNTGILFETDGMTGFPTLDDTGNDTWGGAFGLNILTPNFDQQLVLELAFLKAIGNDATRIAPGDQAGLGARYQIPLSNAWILRSDVMYGFLENTPDIHGARVELRQKF